jgi:hypothetical protein
MLEQAIHNLLPEVLTCRVSKPIINFPLTILLIIYVPVLLLGIAGQKYTCELCNPSSSSISMIMLCKIKQHRIHIAA